MGRRLMPTSALSRPGALIETSAGSGRVGVSLIMLDTGKGWVGSLTGGESPHVGGIVLAVPRPSLSGNGAASCDLYSVPVPGHLDNEVGRGVAKALCESLGTTVALSSGIHLDHASLDELRAIQANCTSAQDHFLSARLGGTRKRDDGERECGAGASGT